MSEIYDQEVRTTHLCKLDNGKVAPYNAVTATEDAYNPTVFRCIGRGIIESIDGIKQNDNRKLYFFIRQ